MAFTTLMLFQLFNVFNARSDDASAFSGLFTNGWLWAAVGLSLVLHVAVIRHDEAAQGEALARGHEKGRRPGRRRRIVVARDRPAEHETPAPG